MTATEIRRQWIHPQFGAVAGVFTLMVLYGSLYPFQFRPRPGSPLAALLADWRDLSDPGDLLSNVLLYLPLGFFGVRALAAGSAFRKAAAVFAFGLALSLSMECVQFYEPRRVASLSDVYANAAGALAGALAALELRRVRQPFVIALLGCWIGYRLFPYGTPDSSRLSLIDLCRHTAAWPAIGALLESLTGLHRSRWLIGMFAVTLWLTRMLVTGALPSPAELLGGALGCLLWALASLAPDKASYRKRAALAAMLLTVAVILQSLEPFEFSAAAQPFGWVPFRQFMIGSLAMAPLVLFGKAFTYGSLVWLWVRAGSPWGLATAACGVLVLCLLLIQTHLPARPAEITDAVILLMAAAFLRLVR